jgi:NDP-sugar pyrophosphorylase family protein
MKAGIFAAGMGSRFVQAGWKDPKPLIPLQGKPLLGHVLERLFQAGIEEVELLLNEEPFFDAVEAYVTRLPESFRVQISRKTTKTSYESFCFLMDRLSRTPFLLCTVDTIFPQDALKEFLQLHSYPSGCRLVLAATGFVHDEKPLWVEMNEDGRVVRLGESVRNRESVTAGLYLVLRELSGQAAGGPYGALRDFLGELVTSGVEVWAKEFPVTLDIDRPDDLRVAESLMRNSGVDAPA